MYNFCIATNISFVIIDKNVVILDFNSGEFYLLGDEYLPIFTLIKSKGREVCFNAQNQDIELLEELYECDIFTKSA